MKILHLYDGYVLLGLMFLLVETGLCQSNYDTARTYTIGTTDTNRKKEEMKELGLYVDSLNSWQEGHPLPRFLFETNLDKFNLFAFSDAHHPPAYRKMIINKVINIGALREIIATKDPALDFKSKTDRDTSFPYVERPYASWSMKDLAKQRLGELTKR